MIVPRRDPLLWFLVLALSLLLGCGKKGPPQAPLVIVPEPITGLSVHRLASTIYVQFTMPSQNQDGSGPADLGRVDVYGLTMMPAAGGLDERAFLEHATLVASIEVRPPPDGEPVSSPERTDERPAQGEVVTVVERLSPAVLTPVELEEPGDPAPKSALETRRHAAWPLWGRPTRRCAGRTWRSRFREVGDGVVPHREWPVCSVDRPRPLRPQALGTARMSSPFGGSHPEERVGPRRRLRQQRGCRSGRSSTRPPRSRTTCMRRAGNPAHPWRCRCHSMPAHFRLRLMRMPVSSSVWSDATWCGRWKPWTGSRSKAKRRPWLA